jgi:hypothetical protein
MLLQITARQRNIPRAGKCVCVYALQSHNRSAEIGPLKLNASIVGQHSVQLFGDKLFGTVVKFCCQLHWLYNYEDTKEFCIRAF